MQPHLRQNLIHSEIAAADFVIAHFTILYSFYDQYSPLNSLEINFLYKSSSK